MFAKRPPDNNARLKANLFRPAACLLSTALATQWCGCKKSKSASDTQAKKEAAITREEQKKLRLNVNIPPPPTVDAPHEGPLDLLPAKEPGSYRVMRPVAVYRRPSTRAELRGTIKKFTRLPRVAQVEGKGCTAGFLHLAAEAFVCMANLRKDKRPVRAKKQPTLGANNLTPGTYGYIRTGGAKLYPTLPDGYADKNGKPIKQSDTVRWAGKRFYKGMKFWRITTGHFIRGTRVRRFWPSRFAGVHLIKEKKRLPLVFMVSRRRRKIGEKIPPVPVYASIEAGIAKEKKARAAAEAQKDTEKKTMKNGDVMAASTKQSNAPSKSKTSFPNETSSAQKGPVVARLKRYTVWPVDRVVEKGGHLWIHIPDKGWVSSELTRLARFVDPPHGLHPRERWLDIDLDQQVLTAYRGRAPIYTTLISAGVWKYPTPIGLFRITHKVAQANMRSAPTADETYRVDHVPWTMYFKGGYAIHGAYWHNGFGHARSHGCINLAPKDARFIYHFTRPQVPPGWTSLYADAKHPGTAVRIRGTRTEREKRILQKRSRKTTPRKKTRSR
jgi:hypothetical protein